MMDRTLENHPDFVQRRSPALTGVFAALAAASAVALVLCLLNIGSLAGDGTVSWRGRSTTALSGIVAPVLVGLSAFATFLFGWLALSGATRWMRVSTGAVLRGFELRVAGDDAVAAELHRRLATGDPARYLPVPTAKKGEIRVHVYRADADRRAFVTVQRGVARRGERGQTWPLIELRDSGYVQVKRRTADDFARPYVASGGTTDPGLRP